MNSTRRGFLVQATAAGAAFLTPDRAFAAGPSMFLWHRDLLFHEDEGETWLIGERQGRVVIKVDRTEKDVRSMSLLTEDIVPGDGIPVHKHGREDEFIYIDRGEGVLTLGEERHVVTAGSIAFVPIGVWHGLENSGADTLRMVFGYTPAGFEGYFREIGVRPGTPPKSLTPADWSRINHEFHITYR